MCVCVYVYIDLCGRDRGRVFKFVKLFDNILPENCLYILFVVEVFVPVKQPVRSREKKDILTL